MRDLNVIIGGGMAGLMQVFAGHPFDTVKVRHVNSNKSLLHTIKSTKGFYRGVSSPLIGAVLMNVQTFYVFNLLNKYQNNLLAGSLTGLSLALVETPTDYIKSRLQINPNVKYFKLINKNIYKGFTITCLRNFSSVGLYFTSYKYIKSKFDDKLIGSFVGGSAAGFMCWAPSYPLDNIKTRIQTDTSNKYKGIMDCFNKCVKRGGYKSLYTGFVPCIVRSMLVNPFVFVFYELGVIYFN